MPAAEFEEKQYETPANIELGWQQAEVYAAGQVLESVVGYDAAAAPPQNAPIWQTLGIGAPTGLQLIPNLWQRARAVPKAADLPSRYVSLILQYKRPQRLNTANANQWHHWNAPYYRFEILAHQQQILEQLEPALQVRAVVRYACAAFWTYADLQSFQVAQSVLANSSFVAPSSLTGHNFWTYDSAGTTGFANPNGRDVRTDTIRSLWQYAVGAGQKENLLQHLRGLAASLGFPAVTDNTSPGWLNAYAAAALLAQARRQAVFDVFQLGERFGRSGVTWFVVDLENLIP